MATVVTDSSRLDDIAIIRLATERDPAAFNMLVKRYLKPVYNYIFHFVQDATLAEDLTQETFMRAYRALGNFDRNRTFKPWLFAIATNVSKTALKKSQQGELLLSDDGQEINLLENIAAPQSADDLPISDQRMADLVQQALGKLSPSVRQAIILRHVYDLSYESVAQVMDVNINTVRTWLRRGRESLKTILENSGGLN
jgi:RNA polymerase sigma-70 factor, ECF subfamily